MESRRVSQKWILDTFLRIFGMDILHPDSKLTWVECGFHPTDFEKVMARIKGGDWQVKAYVTRAAEVEAVARRMEEDGLALAARDLYLRASVLWGRAQYHIQEEHERKVAYHAKCVECFERMAALNPTPIERVEIPVLGGTVYAVLHLPAGTGAKVPAGTGAKVPAVIMFPGGDMIKEYWTQISLRYFLERGMATLTFDGPGQGETRLHGLTLRTTLAPDAKNRAPVVRALVDYLASRPEIDADRIGAFGVSGGCRGALISSGVEPRIKAAAGAMSALAMSRDAKTIMHWGPPHFTGMLMYAAGMTDEEEFWPFIVEARAQPAVELQAAAAIRSPVLLVAAEFDEVSAVLEGHFAVWERISTSKELWVYEDQFHTLGPVYSEVQAACADWLRARLDGVPMRDADIRRYIRTDGRVIEGDARPPWWSPERLLKDQRGIVEAVR